MMDYTDRHCRYFLRLLSPSALLYTEMITAAAIVRGNPERLLAYDPLEHPVALQLGGSDPLELQLAARAGAQFGYDEINLNCGCPSDRVQSGRFGACLMGDPVLVAECITAMREVVAIPVTVKCRIGIEPKPDSSVEDYRFLCDFISSVAAAGCSVFIIHARRAMLHGLSPKENREIPPLQYETVQRVRADFPSLTVIVNGGIRTRGDALRHLESFDGVMIGREAYQNPYLLAELHQVLSDPAAPLPERDVIVERLVPYVRARLAEGHRLRSIVRHLHGLYAGKPRARSWRRFLSEQAAREAATEAVLLESLRIVREAA